MLNNSQLDGSKPFGETRPWAQAMMRHAEHVEYLDNTGTWITCNHKSENWDEQAHYRLSPDYLDQFECTFRSWPPEMQQAFRDAYEDGCEILSVYSVLGVIAYDSLDEPDWAGGGVFLPGDTYEPKENERC